MAKDRIPISEDVAARVLFESDRTCCVCRVSTKVQIHHIDEDPSNNHADNLAVICLLCHDDTQLRGGFSRKLNASLVRMYRDSWVATVRLKLAPEADSNRRILIAEALQEVIEITNGWRNIFRYFIAPDDPIWEAADIWTRVIELAPTSYSAESYERLRDVFDIGIKGVVAVFDRVQTHCGDALPHDVRAMLLRRRRQLETESRRYHSFPKDYPRPGEMTDLLFAQLCRRVLESLRDTATMCETRQAEVLGDLPFHDDPPDDDDE